MDFFPIFLTSLAVTGTFPILSYLSSHRPEPPQKQHMQHTAKQALLKTSKPQPKESAPIRKPATQKPAIKSTYSASYGRPYSAKSLMQPTSSQGSAKMYLDSVLNKEKKNGTDSKAVSRKPDILKSDESSSF